MAWLLYDHISNFWELQLNCCTTVKQSNLWLSFSYHMVVYDLIPPINIDNHTIKYSLFKWKPRCLLYIITSSTSSLALSPGIWPTVSIDYWFCYFVWLGATFLFYFIFHDPVEISSPLTAIMCTIVRFMLFASTACALTLIEEEQMPSDRGSDVQDMADEDGGKLI